MRTWPPSSGWLKWVALAAVVAAGTIGTARGDEITSGPQVGTTIPGRFEPLLINGPNAGDELCLYCRYGNARVAMIFARKPSAELAKLIRAVEKAVAGTEKPAEVGACVIVTDTSAAVKRQLGQLADDANLKHVTLGVIDPAKVTDYALNPAAELTVLLYDNKVVRSNHAVGAGRLTAGAVRPIAAAVQTHLGKK